MDRRGLVRAALVCFALTMILLFVWCAPAHAYTAKVHRWAPVIRAACSRYHISASNTTWAVARGLHIIDGESGGGVYDRSGYYQGLWQYGSSWTHRAGMGFAPGHHHYDWRHCGTCSTYRAAKSLHDGGRAAWYRAWAATIR